MNLTRKILMMLFILFQATTLVAKESAGSPAMADVMRSNGKIYVVVAVIALIFIGIVFYLFRIEGKLRKLEKQVLDDQ